MRWANPDWHMINTRSVTQETKKSLSLADYESRRANVETPACFCGRFLSRWRDVTIRIQTDFYTAQWVQRWATGCRSDELGFDSRGSRPTLWPTQPPIQLLPGAISARGVKLIVHPNLVPKSRTVERYPNSLVRLSIQGVLSWM
jgi:hypothetical protein